MSLRVSFPVWPKVIVWPLCLVFSGLLQAVPAIAATKLAYDASLTSIQAPKELAPGASGTVTVTAKNIGTQTWRRDGKNFFSIYHWNPVTKKEVPSVLSTPGWNSNERPVRLTPATVAPGATVTFSFPIRAPSTPGKHSGDFILTAENVAWIKNGKFRIEVTVKAAATASVPTPSTTPAATVVSTDLPIVSSKWAAELVSSGGTEWQIEMEDHKTVELAFKNVGTETWRREGGSYVSLYATSGTKERQSTFKDERWPAATQAGKLVEVEVKPGQVGHFKFDLRAPRAPGAYREEFTLAAEDTAWVSGGKFSLPVRVPMTGEFIATASPDTFPADIQVNNGVYVATLLLRSAASLTLSGNGRQEVTFGFKNTGSSIWTTRSLKVKGVSAASTGASATVRDESWGDPIEPIRVQGATKPGEIGFLTFKVKAPVRKGSYHATFQLYADGIAVEGGEIDIPITVTADGYIEPEPTPVTKPTNNSTPSNSSLPSLNPIPLTGDVSSLPNEPMIRVGIFATTDNRMVVRAKFAPLTVSQNGSSVCRLALNESVTVEFDRSASVYRLSGGPCVGQSTGYYAVKADDGISPMEMSDFSRPVSWLPGANDNTFRAHLELRYTPSTDKVWVINELPIESYLKGIAETSNVSPQEYQRALLTGARTYAMYHVQRGTKHADEFYIVDATYDQVYRGYGAEARGSNIVAAVDATRGQIVTYDGKLAITPYYSRSDGRTRSWGEVWYGGSNYPWLVSVPVPWDVGRTLWGHGVGLSATGALAAANEGWTYDRILKHFYTGIELRRAYK